MRTGSALMERGDTMTYENLIKLRNSFVNLLNACPNKDPIDGTFHNDFARAIVKEVDGIVEDKRLRKHGRWKIVSDDEMIHAYECTVCRMHLANAEGFSFCPYCGSKMDEKWWEKNDEVTP